MLICFWEYHICQDDNLKSLEDAFYGLQHVSENTLSTYFPLLIQVGLNLRSYFLVESQQTLNWHKQNVTKGLFLNQHNIEILHCT